MTINKWNEGKKKVVIHGAKGKHLRKWGDDIPLKKK